VPFHVYTRRGIGAVGIIVETAGEALAKAAEFLRTETRTWSSRTFSETLSITRRW
jgi:hypothetical protein